MVYDEAAKVGRKIRWARGVGGAQIIEIQAEAIFEDVSHNWLSHSAGSQNLNKLKS